MTENIGQGAAFIATGTIAGASFSATVGGIGLVGGFGSLSIGMAPVAAVGGVVGAAAYGAFQGIGKGDAAAYGAIGIGAVSGIGVYSAVGGMGVSLGGTAFGIGMGTMAATGGLIGLAVYGIAKLIDRTGSGETPAQAFTRMEEKVLQMEDYASALMELEEELSGEAWKRKFARLEIEDELNALKEKLHSKPRSYFNFTTANLHQLKFRPFPKTEKYATKSPPQKNQGEPKILSLKVQQSQAWKCVQTIEAHSATINSIAIANNNEIVASASNDRTVSLWNLKTGKRIYSFFGYSKEAYAVAISPDSQILVTGDFDQKVTRWNIPKKELISTCFYLNSLNSHLGFVYSVVFSPDGKLFASASGDKTIRIWGRFTGEIKRTLNGHSDAVLSLAITPDSKNIVSSSVDRTIIIWDLDSGRIIRVLQGHSGWVTSVAISEDSQKIVTGSTDSTIKLWNLHTGELIRTFQGESEKIFSVAISPDGKTIASSSNKKITIWNLDKGEILQKLSGCYPVAFSPDGKNLVTGGNGGKIKIWQQYFSNDELAKETLLSGEWWEILGVEQNANREDVKRAYRNLAMQYHPDLNHAPTAKVNMQKIVAAYKQYRRK